MRWNGKYMRRITGAAAAASVIGLAAVLSSGCGVQTSVRETESAPMPQTAPERSPQETTREQTEEQTQGETIAPLLEPLGLRAELLTGRIKGKNREKILTSLENGEIEEELNYEFWIANRKIYSFSIEFEHENGKEELEVSTSFGSGLLDEWLGTTIRYDRESENGRNIINAHIRQGKLEAGVQIWAVENAEEGKHVFGYRITDETAWNQIFDDLFGTEEPAPAQ